MQPLQGSTILLSFSFSDDLLLSVKHSDEYKGMACLMLYKIWTRFTLACI
jgi:hypothetical protein